MFEFFVLYFKEKSYELVMNNEHESGISSSFELNMFLQVMFQAKRSFLFFEIFVKRLINFGDLPLRLYLGI